MEPQTSAKVSARGLPCLKAKPEPPAGTPASFSFTTMLNFIRFGIQHTLTTSVHSVETGIRWAIEHHGALLRRLGAIASSPPRSQRIADRFHIILCLSLGAPLAAAPAYRPNIVFILVDDLRWDELRCTGHPFCPIAERGPFGA